MKKFTINGKEYVAREFDYNLMCDFSEMGIAMEDFMNQSKMQAVIRAYFASCANIPKEIAGAELGKHFIAVGNFDELTTVFAEQLESSDFFRSILKEEEEKNPTGTEKKTAKTAKK